MKLAKVGLMMCGLMLLGTMPGPGGSVALAQGYGHPRGYHGYRVPPRRPPYGYYVQPRGYSFGSSYYGGGRYGRPWGYSSSFGYAPGYGSYFGSSYYGGGFGYSSYGGYYR